MTKDARMAVMADLDEAATDFENEKLFGLMEAAEDCREALFIFGPRAEKKVFATLTEIEAAAAGLETKRVARARKAKRVSNQRKAKARGTRKAKYDGKPDQERLRGGEKRRMPPLGKGVQALRQRRLARLGLTEQALGKVIDNALDRFLDD